jgi:hypothetical protein
MNSQTMDYIGKAKASFKTKLILYLFSKVIANSKDLSQEDFIKFEIDSDLVDCYTTEYWQEFKEQPICGKQIEAIQKEIIDLEIKHAVLFLSWQKYYIENFENIFARKDFDDLVKQDFCQYCGITKAQIEELGVKHKFHKKNYRGWNLEIDRLDSNLEYKKDNCVMACYWCNNAKTDEFTPAEFIPIAEKIREVWMKRLNGN